MGAKVGSTRLARWVDSRTHGVSGTHPLATQWGVGGWPRVLGVEQGGEVGSSWFSTHPGAFFPQIRIRDPNQGGKDITEEIMSGARTASTPTPPQVLSDL